MIILEIPLRAKERNARKSGRVKTEERKMKKREISANVLRQIKAVAIKDFLCLQHMYKA